MVESFLKDLRQSLRMFWHSRGFTAAAVSALALGIGANTAIFSVVNAVLLKPVPFPDPERLVLFQTTSPEGNNNYGSPAKFQHLREQTQVVEDVAAFNTGVVNYTSGAFPEQLRSGRVSADFFKLFGARVLMGRTFNAAEDLPGGDKVVILSYQLWSRRFNSDPEIIGKTISLSISPGYFDVFKIPLKRGRVFTDRDTHQSPDVVIINETLAKRFFEKSDPLNERLIIGRGVMREFASEPERQIVGIVGDVRNGGLDNDPGPMMYIPQAQVPDAANALNVSITPMSWVVRTQVPPRSVSEAVQEQLRQASGLAVANVRTMDEVVSRSTSRQQFNMWLMTVFGACALLLAAIGIYGLMAYSVEQRTQEIGIRLALGAPTGHVKNMVVRQGMMLAAIGLVVGLAASLALSRFVEAFLFRVQARDPLVFIGVPILLGFVAFLAVWLPARRASLIDPIIALRTE